MEDIYDNPVLSKSHKSHDSSRASSLSTDRKRFDKYDKYLVHLLYANIFLLACYAVLAYTESPECLVRGGQANMTNWFDKAFEGGFCLHFVSLMLAIFAEPFFVKLTHKQTVMKMTTLQGFFLLAVFVIEVLVRFAIYFASVL